MKWFLSWLLTASAAIGAATGTNYFDNILETHASGPTNYFDNVVQLHSGTSTQTFANVVSINGSSVSIPTSGLTASNNSASATSLTISGFTVSGSNPYLLVFTAGSSSLTARTLSSATANSVSMTTLFTTNFTSKGNAYICGLANPTSGDIVVTFSGANNQGMSVLAVLLNGTSSVGATDGSFSSSTRTSVSATVASLTTDLVVDYLAGAVWTQGGSQSILTSITSGSAPASGAASKLAGSAGNTTMSWSGTSSTVSHLVAVMHGL